MLSSEENSQVITLVIKFVAGYDKVPSVTKWPNYFQATNVQQRIGFWKEEWKKSLLRRKIYSVPI